MLDFVRQNGKSCTRNLYFTSSARWKNSEQKYCIPDTPKLTWTAALFSITVIQSCHQSKHINQNRISPIILIDLNDRLVVATICLELQCYITASKRSLGKVMFSQVCVCPWGRGVFSFTSHASLDRSHGSPPRHTYSWPTTVVTSGDLFNIVHFRSYPAPFPSLGVTCSVYNWNTVSKRAVCILLECCLVSTKYVLTWLLGMEGETSQHGLL